MAIDDRFVPSGSGAGHPAFPPPTLELSGDGAITIAHGRVVITKATAGAITLDAPPTTMNGGVLHIVSTTAAAHVITHEHFDDGANDTATFGGAVGDNFSLLAYGGVWYSLGTALNVTLSDSSA